MRIHLGHHFYGAGNLGDDFMLAGFLAALRSLAPSATFSCCVPFPLGPLRQRFPTVDWQPCDPEARSRCIAACDVWLGLGGSPFQSALSRWFVDHLIGDAQLCTRHARPMYYLGVGVQTADEIKLPEIQLLCGQAAHIWTRDAASAQRLRLLPKPPAIDPSADLAHVYFRTHALPPAKAGRVTLVANFDYGPWPGQTACLDALRHLHANEYCWLAQESRELPGAERALYATLSDVERTRWQLVSPEQPGAALPAVMTHWPSGEWLVTSRYHAALAGAWAGSKILVVTTNEKLRAAARELGTPVIAPDASEGTTADALATARPQRPPTALADHAWASCAAFVRSAVAHRR